MLNLKCKMWNSTKEAKFENIESVNKISQPAVSTFVCLSVWLSVCLSLFVSVCVNELKCLKLFAFCDDCDDCNDCDDYIIITMNYNNKL